MAQHREVLRVSGCTLARPLCAFEAVATDTPERKATSRNVTARGREAVLWVSVTLPLVTVRSQNPLQILVLMTHRGPTDPGRRETEPSVNVLLRVHASAPMARKISRRRASRRR